MKTAIFSLLCSAIACVALYAADPIMPNVIGDADTNVVSPAPAATISDALPADRPRYLLLTDAELSRVNLADLFAVENPEAWAASGGSGIDFAAYFGLQSCVAKSASGLTATKRMGWLAPEAFALKFAEKLHGASGWDKLPSDAPRPEWLKKQ